MHGSELLLSYYSLQMYDILKLNKNFVTSNITLTCHTIEAEWFSFTLESLLSETRFCFKNGVFLYLSPRLLKPPS